MSQIFSVGQGLAPLLNFQKSINSRCLMTPDGFIGGSVVTGPYVASCLDDSFVHQSDAMERVSTYCDVYTHC
jgi:hypothetical protein